MGLSMVPKLRVPVVFGRTGTVGEYSNRNEGEGVTHAGMFRSKNVGTSNHNPGEKPGRRKNKVSLATFVAQGLVGPKEMARAASDGYTVNIP